MTHSVLIVDDDDAFCQMLETSLGASAHADSATSAMAALKLLEQRDFDVVVTDIRMRHMDGVELCKRVVESRPDVPVIVMTAFGSMETAIEALRAGAHDFVTKPFDLDTLRIAITRAVEHRELCRKVQRLEQALHEPREMGPMLGASRPIRQVFDLIERVAPSDATVLVTGESGTGKELVARALHERSPRRGGPFVAINCAAMPETLLESELFGYAKGAFTDAKSARPGLFRQADGGTLFLDEIGDLPLGFQPKLLRVLQEKTVRPVGGDTEASVNVRLVTATNRDLEDAVADGLFREDLYYRIHVIQIEVPPLRVRGNDILILAQHFVNHFSATHAKPVTGFVPAAARTLLAYSWPGNVRELQNCVERAVTLCRHSEITVADLPDKVTEAQPSHPVLDGEDSYELMPMQEVERRHVLRVYESTGQNKSLAAKVLGFNRKTLYRKLRSYGVIPPEPSDLDR